jgi:dihydroorotate dehydrogenase electron transfer subunit
MKQVQMTLTEKTPLTADVWQLRFAGDTSPITHPGQFVNLELPGRFLRRPISVCDWDEETLTLLVRVAGKGTAELCQAQPGTVFDLLSGLGNGFDPDECTGNPILIGGGIGTAPLYGLARRMAQKGKAPTVALGFNTAADVFYLKEFTDLGCHVFLSTVDGSLGAPGFVTELVAKTECDYCFVCGPGPMLRAVLALPQLTDGQISFEERMGCGFGACVGCTMETKNGPRRVCKDGPVFRKEEIL